MTEIEEIVSNFVEILKDTSSLLKSKYFKYGDYRKRRIKLLRELRGVYKELRNELKVIENEKLKEIVERLDKDIEIICNDEHEGKYRHKIVERILSDRLDVDIKLQIKDIYQIPLEFKRIATSMGSNFEKNFKDMSLVYGKSGTLTAFMLRKILEKATYLAFLTNDLEEEVKNGNKIIGLEKMLNIAAKTKINNIPILTTKLANILKKIKFLGDKAAHHPLIEVDMEEIIPQLDYFQTAFQELSKHIK